MCIIYLGKTVENFYYLIKRPTNSKQKTPVPVCLLRVDHGLPRENG
jgi:hypothetical protein